MELFDYVIAGGGTAACILAARLGEAGHSVCLIEAGRADDTIWTRIPAGFTRLLRDPAYAWQLKYEASAGTAGRAVPLVQGRTLGGSSAVNGAVISRGQAFDYDGWAELGNAGWGHADVLPYFKRNEHFFGGADDRIRGREGRLNVAETMWRDTTSEAFLASAVQAGIPRTADYNGERQDGIGWTQSNIHHNRRWSAAHAYLHPARRRFDVRVLTEAVVTRIVFEGRRATGLAWRPAAGGAERQVAARREVLVCAGTIHSPKLLQLSGIGPQALLREHGVPVLQALAGVGENLRDHYVARIVARARPGVYSVNGKVKGLALARQVAAWALGRPSVLAISPILLYAFWKTRPELRSPDFALSFMPVSSTPGGRIGELDARPGLSCGAWQLRPRSQGFVRIRSNRIEDAPLLQPRFLDDPEDQRVIVEGLKWARKAMATGPVSDLIDTELLPGDGVRSDDQLLDYARTHGGTCYHPVGSCRMGPAGDPLAVVDPALRVQGLQGLRVVDASVMPTIPSGNTCAATMMIAEKAADLLLADAKR
jgi:choline dehydrogenase